jgi:two-component system, NarL family, nitrate/nitrite response regulator NarL
MPTLCGVIVSDGRLPAGETMAIVAERRLSAAALLALLLANSNYRVVDQTHGLAGIRAAIETYVPTILLFDSAWSGPTILMDLTPNGRECRVLALLGPDDDSAVFARAATARVHGYVSRSASGETLGEALTSLRSDGEYVDPLLAPQVRSAMNQSEAPSPAARQQLSRREHQVLVGIASGQSTKEVAREYAISAKTVANHVNNICQKLNLNHRAQMVLYAARHGLTVL